MKKSTASLVGWYRPNDFITRYHFQLDIALGGKAGIQKRHYSTYYLLVSVYTCKDEPSKTSVFVSNEKGEIAITHELSIVEAFDIQLALEKAGVSMEKIT